MRHMLWVTLVLTVLLIPCTPCLAAGPEPLLVAVASNDVESTALVGDFAGRSEYYLLFSGLNMVQVLRNPFLDKGTGAGPLVVDYLAEKGVTIIVAGRFGPPMIEAMNRKGMKYFLYSGVAQEAVERVMNYLKPGKKGGREKPGDRGPAKE